MSRRRKSEANNRPSVKSALTATWARFAGTTTLGGLVQAYEAIHIVPRLGWILIFLGLSGATVWNTQRVVADYLNYPVTTAITVSYKASLPFPSVTICNRNPVQCPKLVAAYLKYPDELRSLLEYSFCWKTIGSKALIKALVENQDEKIKQQIRRWQENVTQISGDGTWGSIDVNTKECNVTREYLNNTGFSDILDHLINDCGADLKSLLLPGVRDPTPNASSNATLAAKNDTDTDSEEDGDYEYDAETRNPVADILVTEKFFIELGRVARNASLKHIMAEVVDDFYDFIVNCTYNTESCHNADYFAQEFFSVYGTCFTFNTALATNDPVGGKRLANTTGSLFGLSLELMLNQPAYMPSSAASGAGGRVTISPPGSRVSPNSEGYFIKPNTETDFGMKLTQITRLPEPYTSKCWGSWAQTAYQPLAYVNATSNGTHLLDFYSYHHCQTMCASKLFIDICKCLSVYSYDPFLYKSEEYTKNMSICDTTIEEVARCTTWVWDRFQAGQWLCECQLPCEDVRYETMLSMSQWPSNLYSGSLMKKYSHVLSKVAYKDVSENGSFWTEIGSMEFARVNIYFQTLMVEQMDENEKYDLSQILSDLGGALGLYLGICGVTVFEVAEFLVMVSLSLVGLNKPKVGNDGSSTSTASFETGNPEPYPYAKPEDDPAYLNTIGGKPRGGMDLVIRQIRHGFAQPAQASMTPAWSSEI